MQGATLKGLDLSGIKLQGANLKDADLSGTNLNTADLGEANLWGANLNQAKLSSANLKRADLSWAQLNEAILPMANLDGAKLSNAQLIKADFKQGKHSMVTIGWGAFATRGKPERRSSHRYQLHKSRLECTAKLSEADIRKINLSEAILLDVAFNKTVVGAKMAGEIKGLAAYRAKRIAGKLYPCKR